MWAAGLFFALVLVASVVAAFSLSPWILLAAFLATWAGSAATLKGSLVVRIGGGLLVGIGALLVGVFVTSVFVGASLV